MPRWLYVLLVAVPLSVLSHGLGLAPVLVFVLAAIGIIPLAGLIAISTETLAERTGPQVGGLLNATFGNAAELIIGIAAIANGLPMVVRASITGSIIGNALLVLGSAMLLGGWRHGTQRFNARHASQYATLLALAVVGLVIPSIMASVGVGARAGQGVISGQRLHLYSVVISIVLLLSYVAYLAYSVFGLHAHGPGQPQKASASSQSAPPKPPEPDEAERAGDDEAFTTLALGIAAEVELKLHTVEHDKKPVKQAQLAKIGTLWHTMIWLPIAVLGVVTALTAVVSELLVGAIQPVAQQVGLNPFFVGLIILPIVGNAAEHATAITTAVRDQMDITLAITAGSSIQVALLVAPVLVLVSPLVGTPLDLAFSGLELVIFALVMVLYALVSFDGESTWLEGLLLGAFYLIVAASAFFAPL